MDHRNNFIGKNTEGRRFVIGSIYGCLYSLQSLLFHKIKIRKNDQIFLLGNYIDKGNNSKEVLDFIIELIAEDYNIYPIRGKQEENLLHMLEEDEDVLELYLSINHSTDLLVNNKIPQKYISFLHNLSYFYETEEALLVHAGFNVKHPHPLEDKVSMLYVQNTENDLGSFTGKKIFSSSQINSIEAIQDKINAESTLISLNNAAYRASEPHNSSKELGNICALDLDKSMLVVQNNLDIANDEDINLLEFEQYMLG